MRCPSKKCSSPALGWGILALLVSACEAEPEGSATSTVAEQVPLEEIYQSQQCNVADQHLRLIESAEELSRVTSAQLDLQGAEPAEVAADFAENYVVLVAQGQRTSSGYGIELTSRTAEITDDMVDLPVQFNSPPEGVFTAQVMTSPCLVVAFPKTAVGGHTNSVVAGPMTAALDGTNVQ